MAAVSSKSAQAYLIDPLTAPEPSQETGPGSHFVRPVEESSPVAIPRDTTGSSVNSNNPYRQRRSTGGSASSPLIRGSSPLARGSPQYRHTRNTSLGSQPDKSPRYRHEAFGDIDPPAYEAGSPRSRSSSLRERFPGDDSHKPLDIIRRDSKKANRSPHLTKRHLPGVDSIDGLDHAAMHSYHHEGPYDAASLARNTIPGKSPIDALKSSNEEAIKATPVENIKDSVRHHMPLSGTAIVPPGEEDRFGRKYEYEEGPNQMIDGNPGGGPYKRYDGVTYHPDDIKGKGEPSYSRDLALKEKERRMSGHRQSIDGGIELSDAPSSRPRSGSFADGLKKRLSIRKKRDD